MVILITGASHTGKTCLAQRLLERYGYPYLSVDHLKMGLIRSRNTGLTPEDDEELTSYLWPIVREMIKTSIENDQNLIVEGCYVPYDWRDDLEEQYLRNIRFICLAMTEGYIDACFDEIRSHACDIESRLDDGYLTSDFLKDENRRFAEGFSKRGEMITLIEGSYERTLDEALLMIPDGIRRIIGKKEYTIDRTGMSGSTVMIFDDMVLKITDSRYGNEDQVVGLMRWLKGKLSVPEVISYEADERYQFLLMSRIKGKMSCDGYYLEHPKELIPLLAEAINTVHTIDISGCPVNRDIDEELKEARYRLENGLVDISDAEPDTFGKGGFEDPAALLKWLEDNKPSSETVFTHGDLCLPNILIDNGKISGFIDLGSAGTGDKWRDIALCYRSLKHNFDGTYGGKVYPGVDPDMLFDALGIEPDMEKIRYYILLDELF